MSFLIRHCRLYNSERLLDVHLVGGRVSAIGQHLAANAGDTDIDAAGATLLPGLHDHHIHLLSLAASLDSVACGPPAIRHASELGAELRQQNQISGEWMRGIAYHPCVAGDIDRHWLDRWIPDRPARIQHRGGRLWVLNSSALKALGLLDSPAPENTPAGVERQGGTVTGRLYECDHWLRQQLRSTLPSLQAASKLLSSYGVTGITDTTPHNSATEWDYFQRMQLAGDLVQSVRMMGTHALADLRASPLLNLGEFKVHLLESSLPSMDALCTDIQRAHACGRGVAIHCVTLAELVFALAGFEQAGARKGDRIEHASITPPAFLDQIRALGLRVVTQPHFPAERGDQYRVEVDASEQAWLYRLRAFLQAGVPLAAGSDAPFGRPDPWRAMAAAVNRRTDSGEDFSPEEALSPEQALALYLSPPDAPGLLHRTIEVGMHADLCLLDMPWAQACTRLSSDRVRMTWRDGELIHRAE